MKNEESEKVSIVERMTGSIPLPEDIGYDELLIDALFDELGFKKGNQDDEELEYY